MTSPCTYALHTLAVPLLQHHSYRGWQLLVECCAALFHGRNLRRASTPIHLSILLCILLWRPTLEPAALSANPKLGAFHGPIGSHGTISWRCH